MEIMIESLPSGALQIYVAILQNSWSKWLETASIIASLVSVGWGLMTSTSRGIYANYEISFPKWPILWFCVSDFIVNTVPLSMFISLRNIRSFSMFVFFPTILFIGVLRRKIEVNGESIFFEGVVDGFVWMSLSVISSAVLVTNPANTSSWNLMSMCHRSLFLRFLANLAFFLTAVIVDLSNETSSFSSYLPYYIGTFVLAHLILMISIYRLTGAWNE